MPAYYVSYIKTLCSASLPMTVQNSLDKGYSETLRESLNKLKFSTCTTGEKF